MVPALEPWRCLCFPQIVELRRLAKMPLVNGRSVILSTPILFGFPGFHEKQFLDAAHGTPQLKPLL
jgi:hypothetical protein